MMIVFVLLFRLGLFQSALAGPSEDQAMQRGPIFTAVESAVDCYQIFKRFEEYVAEHAGPEGNITLYDTESIQKVSSNCWGQFNSMGFPKIAHINPTEILLDVTAFLYQQGYGPATGFLVDNYELSMLANVTQLDIFDPRTAHNRWGGRNTGRDYIGDVNNPDFMSWILPSTLGDAFQRTIDLWDV